MAVLCIACAPANRPGPSAEPPQGAGLLEVIERDAGERGQLGLSQPAGLIETMARDRGGGAFDAGSGLVSDARTTPPDSVNGP